MVIQVAGEAVRYGVGDPRHMVAVPGGTETVVVGAHGRTETAKTTKVRRKRRYSAAVARGGVAQAAVVQCAL